MTMLIRKHFESIDSTNNWAKKNAARLDRNAITLVTADHQTAGRGRFNRTWTALKGKSVLASFCFFIPELRSDIGSLAQVMAVSGCEVLGRYGIKSRIHWPNDIMVGRRKIAGVLCETTPVDDQTVLVVVGLGLNVNMTEDELAEVGQPATSILIETGQVAKNDEVLTQLEKTFCQDLELFLAEGFPALYDRFMHHWASV
jgi:BirA family biotin operon repressor/biotin-[acetyl-CoA-carboxylase] ligase